MDKTLYRPCVGVVVINHQGLVFAGHRLGLAAGMHAWQMPQGGIDDGESPKVAAFRELEEETGITTVEILDRSNDWLNYEFPENMPKRFNGIYKGQTQMWFALKFTGADDEVNLDHSGHAEFSDWAWLPPSEIIKRVVPFKRTVYEAVMNEFSPFFEAS